MQCQSCCSCCCELWNPMANNEWVYSLTRDTVTVTVMQSQAMRINMISSWSDKCWQIRSMRSSCSRGHKGMVTEWSCSSDFLTQDLFEEVTLHNSCVEKDMEIDKGNWSDEEINQMAAWNSLQKWVPSLVCLPIRKFLDLLWTCYNRVPRSPLRFWYLSPRRHQTMRWRHRAPLRFCFGHL